MQRSLVTGATGFIGARLVRRLVERGDEVACLVRSTSDTSNLESLGVRLLNGSLGDAGSLAAVMTEARPDAVYHLAGLTHAVKTADFHRVNAEGTKALVEAAAALDVPPTFVLVSSLAAAGPSPPGVPHTEATRSAPVSEYGKSKLLGEDLARQHAGATPLSIVRPPVVFGAGDRDGLLLFKSLRAFPLHAVPQLKGLPLSLIHVDDLVDALTRVADRGERVRPFAENPTEGLFDPTGLYYAADPTESSYAEMGRMAAAAMDKKVWVLCRRKYPFLPLALAGDLWARWRGKAPLFGMDKLREASASGWVCDPAKITEQLAWAPAERLAERYAETHAWYREAGWL